MRVTFRSDELCTVTEAAGIVGVTRTRMHQYIQDGRIHPLQLGGRYFLHRLDVQALIERRKRRYDVDKTANTNKQA